MMTLETYQQYRDGQWNIPEKVELPKKKIPAYVAQFGVNHIKKRVCKN